MCFVCFVLGVIFLAGVPLSQMIVRVLFYTKKGACSL
jgi:hypothetical protein